MELWVIYELPTEVRYLVLERRAVVVPYRPRSENIQPVERNSTRGGTDHLYTRKAPPATYLSGDRQPAPPPSLVRGVGCCCWIPEPCFCG